MYIGSLSSIATTSFVRAGTTIPFPPTKAQDGVYAWAWNTVFDTAFDVCYTLSKDCYVGAVWCEILPEALVRKVEVISGGKIVGSYSAETGKNFNGNVNIPVGTQTNEIRVRFFGDVKHVSFKMPELLGAYDDEAPLLWPMPKKASYEKTLIKIKNIDSGCEADEIFAASFLKEGLAERYGDFYCNTGATITFKLDKSEAYDKQRFTITASCDGITVTAGERIALLYGATTLIQLYHECEAIPECTIDDTPTNELRGFHCGLPALSAFDFMKRLYKYVLLPLRYNTAFVEFCGGMRFERHPEISEAWLKATENHKAGLQPAMPHAALGAEGTILEKDDVREYVGFLKELGFEVIPEVQSLGHVQYITYAHPEIAELEENAIKVLDTRAEDARPDEFYAHSYCPSMKESYDIIYDIIDEIVEVVKPSRYVHMGHDEVYQLGICKRCRNTDPSELYARHINAMRDYLLNKYGLGTMIWCDMIHPTHKAKDAVTMLYKDIVLLDFIWYFHFDKDIEDNILPHGFKMVMGNLYSSHYPRYKSRIAKPGFIGGQISTWVQAREDAFADIGKFWDAIYLSEMLWNSESYDERQRRTYTDVIAKYVQPVLRDSMHSTYNAKGYSESYSVSLPGEADNVPCEVRKAYPNAVIVKNGNVEINDKLDRVIFDQAALFAAPVIAWEKGSLLGNYTVEYEDGTTELVPVRYGNNIIKWDLPYAEPMPQQYYRHTGYVSTWFVDPVYVGKRRNGETFTILGLVWDNPNPDKKIAKISYTANEKDYCMLISAAVRGLKKN